MKTGLKMVLAGLLLVAVAVVAGCGSGSGSTSGTITLADITAKDLTGGKFSIESKATYVPSSGAVLPGTEISYRAVFTMNNVEIAKREATISSDGSGSIPIGPWTVDQDISPIIVTISAWTGGIPPSTKITSIPTVAGLTANPESVTFANTESVKTVNLTGGSLPYKAISSTTDITASVNGSIVTLTKTVASGDTSTTSNITITDSSEKFTVVIQVTYSK